MKKQIILGGVLALSLVLHAELAISDDAAPSPAPDMQALQNQVFQLQSLQDNVKKQFKNVEQQIQKVQSQISKINSNFEKQLQDVKNNNQKVMQQMQQGYEKNLQGLNAKLNSLKDRLSKSPAAKPAKS